MKQQKQVKESPYSGIWSELFFFAFCTVCAAVMVWILGLLQDVMPHWLSVLAWIFGAIKWMIMIGFALGDTFVIVIEIMGALDIHRELKEEKQRHWLPPDEWDDYESSDDSDDDEFDDEDADPDEYSDYGTDY